MSSEHVIRVILDMVVWRGPLVLVVLIGLVYCIMQLRKHPAPAQLAVTALTIMLFSQFLGIGIYLWQVSNTGPMSNYRTMVWVLGFVHSLMFAASVGVLLLAVFKNRHQPNYDSENY